MNLHKIAIAALSLALFGFMAIPHGAQAQEQDSLTYERLSSTLGDLDAQTQALGQLDAQNVGVIDIEDTFLNLDDNQRQRLREMYRNTDTDALHDAVENSPTIMEALKNETGTQIDASDVVAIDMREGGQIIAYVDPNDALKGRGTDDVQQQGEEWQDRDSTEVGDVQQQDEQQRERDSLEMGDEMGEARQKDPQTFERIHTLMHDMKTHTETLTQTAAQEMEEQQTDAQNVRVVHVEDVISDLDDEQIQRLRRTYQDAETDELHSALENNEAIKNALETNTTAQIDASDVVAIDAQEGGETVVYVDPNDKLKGRGMEDAQQREDEWQDRDASETDEHQQRERDTTEAGNVQQNAQPRDRNTQETGNVQQAAQQQDSQGFERLHTLMHDMKTHTEALTQTGAQEMEDQPADERRTDAESVRVVNVEDVTADLDDEQIQRLRRTYQDAETEELHSALENNEPVMNALKTNTDTELDVSHVVAVDVQEGGETVVYVDPNGELEGDGAGDFE